MSRSLSERDLEVIAELSHTRREEDRAFTLFDLINMGTIDLDLVGVACVERRVVCRGGGTRRRR